MRTACRSTMTEISAMKFISLALAVIMTATIAGSAAAADARKGGKLARQWCSNCHIIGDEQPAGGDAAPTFATIAETAAERNDDLKAWLADPHPPMPDLSLTTYEIDDLLAYIESLNVR